MLDLSDRLLSDGLAADEPTTSASSTSEAKGDRLRTAQWGVIDQALSSGTNFLMVFLVATLVGPTDFGVFSLVVILYTVTIGSSRALAGEPLVIRYASRPNELRSASAASMGLLTAVGIAVGSGCCLAAIAVSEPLRSSLLMLGVAMPWLLMQDGGRVVFFARSEPRRAAANDALWAVLQMIGVGVAVVTDHLTTPFFVATWAFAGAISGLVVLVQLRLLPDLSDWVRWLRKHGDLGLPLVANYVLTTAPSYILFALMPLVSSLRELGIVRAAYLPFSAFGIILQSAWLLLLPAAARASTPKVLLRLAQLWSGGLGALALVWSLLVLAIPARVGELIMGDTWHQTGSVRLFFAGALVAYAIGVGPVIGLRALESPRQLVWIRLAISPATLGLGLAFAHNFGAPGVAFAIFAGDILTALVAWYIFVKIVRIRVADNPRVMAPV
jgi:hypothetical protein